MAEQLNYQINIGGNVYESLGAVKKALKESNAELLQAQSLYGEYSKEAKAAADKVATLRDAIRNANETADLFDPGKKFQTFTNALSAVAGGFAAVQGAIGLLGGESKELEKQLLKVQSALALSQGLSTIADSAKDFKRLASDVANSNIVLKANAVANTATAATMKALGVAVETTSLSFKVLKTAIASTGILLAIVAIGELVSAIMNYTSETEKAAKKQKELNEEIAKGTEAGNKAVKEYLKSAAELEELRAKLAGKGEEEILAIRKKSLNAQIEQNKKDYEQLIKLDKVKASALADENAKLTDELTKLDINFKIEQKKRQEEADKKAIEDSKKKTDEQKRLEQEEEQRRKAKDDRESAAQKVQIDAFRATLTQREQDILKAEDELEAKREVLIRSNNFDFEKIEEEHRIKLAEINSKYDKEDADKKKAIDEINLKREQELAEINAVSLEEKRALELQNLEDQYNKELLLAITNNENILALEQLYAAKKGEINQKYVDLKKQQDEQIIQAEKELADAKFAIASAGLNLVGALVGQNEKFANAIFAIDKALAIAKVIKDAISEIATHNAVGAAFGPLAPAYIAPKVAATKIRAAAGVATIAATTIAKYKGGSASANFGQGGAINTTGTPIIPTQQAQLTQLNQQSINAIGNSAIRAYVVETDITSNQKRIQAIKQRARFS